MKKIFLSLCLLASLSSSFAQENDAAAGEGKKMPYIFKGEYIAGLSMAYSSLSGEDASIYLLLQDINASGSITNIKPSLGYAYRNNRLLGVRYTYNKIDGNLSGALFDLGETNDINFDIPAVEYLDKGHSFGIYHRTYLPIDNEGQFALFAEVELAASMGESDLIYDDGDQIINTHSERTSLSASFNPGLAVFLLPRVSSTLSFEFGGFDFSKINQYDAEGNFTGSRTSSKMRFKFNVLAINFGINVHIW